MSVLFAAGFGSFVWSRAFLWRYSGFAERLRSRRRRVGFVLDAVDLGGKLGRLLVGLCSREMLFWGYSSRQYQYEFRKQNIIKSNLCVSIAGHVQQLRH